MTYPCGCHLNDEGRGHFSACLPACPVCRRQVEVHQEGWLYDHTLDGTLSGDLCPGSGETLSESRIDPTMADAVALVEDQLGGTIMSDVGWTIECNFCGQTYEANSPDDKHDPCEGWPVSELDDDSDVTVWFIRMDDGLWWSNSHGAVGTLDQADPYGHQGKEDARLPIGGHWVEFRSMEVSGN